MAERWARISWRSGGKSDRWYSLAAIKHEFTERTGVAITDLGIRYAMLLAGFHPNRNWEFRLTRKEKTA